MAHLLVPKPLHSFLPVFFNVDGVVGAPPAKNLREDVILVQFAFKVLADNPQGTPPDVVAAARAVTIDGRIGPITIKAISTYQSGMVRDRNPSIVVDGRVSPAIGGTSYGGAAWTIAHLNGTIKKRHINDWPRIDKIPGCPSEIKTMVKRILIGS
jgi:hypothetical protein